MKRKPKLLPGRPISREEAIKRALRAEILREIRTNGATRDEIRAILDDLPPWTPFSDVTHLLTNPLAREMHLSAAAVNKISGGEDARTFQNSRYFVRVSPYQYASEAAGWLLSIRTTQRDARHDWREFQRIKNELCGPECEAVELYPAESRLLDTANQFFLFVLPAGDRAPFGFTQRTVMDNDGTVPGANQRPWEDGQRPDDITVVDPQVVRDLYVKAAADLETVYQIPPSEPSS